MADLATSIAKARKAGYSDAEITAYIGKDPQYGSKVQAARKAGYSDAEIVGHLGKVNTAMDVVKSTASGLMESAAGMADTVLQASPLGMFDSTLKTAAGVAQTLSGKPQTKMANPFNAMSDLAKKNAYTPQTTAGEYGRAGGRNLLNAIAPGSAGARVANVIVPALASEGAGQFAKAAGAGEQGQEIARAVGGVGGAGVASLRPQNLFRQAAPAEAFADRVRQDPAAMTQRANAFREGGVDPTLTDVVDDSGRGLVRAAANRQTGGRQVANDFARSRSLDLPDRIGQQARRLVSDDPRSPDQIRTAMGARRSANAEQAFGSVRGEEMQMAPETVQALRNPMGREAIAEAARRERDPEVRAALLRLSEDALDNPSTPITVGMADRISRTLLGRAEAAARGGDNDLAATFRSLGEAVRGPARQASPGYQSALEGFAADSRLQEAAGVGEGLMRRNTDEFVDAAAGLGGEERDLALAAGRRSIERAAGENVSSAPGVARRLADAPEQRTRNAALMGSERANQFQNAMRTEAQAVDNASAIAPRTGSPTHLNDADAANAAGVVRNGVRILRGQWVEAGMDWLRTRGLNDQQAEAIVRLATDPARTDDAIQAIQQSLGTGAARRFLQWRNAGLIGAAAGATGFRSANEEAEAEPAPRQ